MPRSAPISQVEIEQEIIRLTSMLEDETETFEMLAQDAAEKEGVKLVWGGDWKNFRDGPHFELDRVVYFDGDWQSKAQPPKERTSATESTTVQASAVQIASGTGAGIAAIGGLSGTAQIVALVFAAVVVLAAMWIMRERLKAWADGWK